MKMLKYNSKKIETAVSRNGKLSIVDGKITNIHSEIVILHGISLFWSQWSSKFYDYEWIERLANSWKVTVIRASIGVESGGYLDDPYAERQKVYRVIDAAIKLGLYVVVDWHSHNPFREEAIEFFAGIIQRYGNIDNIIFEIWNEPLPCYAWEADIRPYHQFVVKELRDAGSEHIIICGTGSYCKDIDIAAAHPLELNNVCYALHFYAASHRSGLRGRVKNALDSGICIFASEYGVCESSGDGIADIDEMNKWWEFLDNYGISNINWCLNDKDETCSALKYNGMIKKHFVTKTGRLVREYIRKSFKRQSEIFTI